MSFFSIPNNATGRFRRQTILGFIVPSFIAFVVLVAGYLVFIPLVRSTFLDERKHQTQQMVQSAYSLVNNYYNLYKSGILQEHEAKLAARHSIKNLRYGKTGMDYYWLLDSSGGIISHPYISRIDIDLPYSEPSLKFLAEMACMVNAKGEGFFHYYWQYMDQSDTHQEKIAYLKEFTPWGWIIGTGFYVWEVEEDIKPVMARLNRSLFGIIVVLMLALGVLLWRGLRTAKSIEKREMALVKSEARFRGMANNIENGLIIIEDGKSVFLNQRMCDIIGIKSSEIHDIDLEEFIPDQEHQVYNSILAKIQESERLELDQDIIIKRRDSNLRLLSFHLAHQVRGSTSNTYIVVSDITEQKEVEQRLTTLSETIHQSPDSILLTDSEGNVQYLNERFQQTMGVTLEEVRGKNHRMLTTNSPQEMYDDIIATLEKGHTWRNELRTELNNGQYIWENVNIFPIKRDEGSISGYAVIKTDITSRKLLEQELIEAKEKARQNEQIKTNLLNNISHEVNTPLNAINGFATLLKDELKDHETHYSYIQYVLKSTRILLKLFNDMLEFSVIESGDFKLRREEIRITNLIHKIVTRHNTILTTDWEKDVDIIIDHYPETDKAIIRTDRKRLTQIFDKLLSNAVKFTHKGNVKVGYKINHESIVFYVEDTGVGIPDEEKALIFERFTHGSTLYVSQHKGTGLGLNITKMLVERMGGRLWFTSTMDVGSTFYFSFPLVDVRNYLQDNKYIDSYSHSQMLLNKTVLLADDSEDSYINLKSLIGDSNTRVIWAKDGQQALDMIRDRSNSIDLVLLDVLMPVMDGIAAAAILQSESVDIPALAVTPSEYLLQKHEASLFSAIITKPFKKAKLLDTIYGVLKD